MKEPSRVPESRLDVEGKRSGEKQRTLKDTLLISAGVAGYAGILIAFRVAKAVESVLSSKPAASDGRGTGGEKSAPVK
jgi:hypothetical protein